MLLNGYTPALNNKFTLVTFNSATGFAFPDLALPSDYVSQTAQNSSDVNITVLRTALAACWPADTNATEAVNNRTATQSGGAGFTNGLVEQAFPFNRNPDRRFPRHGRNGHSSRC